MTCRWQVRARPRPSADGQVRIIHYSLAGAFSVVPVSAAAVTTAEAVVSSARVRSAAFSAKTESASVAISMASASKTQMRRMLLLCEYSILFSL